MSKARSRLTVLSALLALPACSGAPDPLASPTLPTSGEAFAATCSAVRPQTEPDLMGWDSGSRANLNVLRHQGVIVVRYRAQGCSVELEVLSNCIARGEYSYEPYPSSDTKIARSANDLFAELPIGAAKLSGKLKGGRALRTDYMLAGVASIPVGSTFSRDGLVGECGRATHVVTKVYLGGFGMAAGESNEIAGGASVFGVGAGASHSASAERIASEGNAEACAKAQADGSESKLCAVPLRIGLLAVEGAEEVEPAAPVAPPAPVAKPQPKPVLPSSPLPSAPPAATGNADRDGDGIPDRSDQCPTEPEDKDGFEDDDGCPDPDNDKDGVVDRDDVCPNQPGAAPKGC